MGKIYNDSLGSLRLIKKQGHFTSDFRGDHMDDIVGGMATTHMCRFCGQPMTPLKDIGNVIIWKCDMPYCVNNQDYKLKFDIQSDFINNAGNTNRKWADFNVRKIA